MRLHGTVGPAAATVSAIAKEAGVQRATVYRHFPDDGAIFEACTAHFAELNPQPVIEAWLEVDEPDERLRLALDELYAWYERTGQMLYLTTIRDAAKVPPRIRDQWLAYADAARDALMRGRPQRGRARQRVSGAIGHAISFPTWLSLVMAQGLRRDEAIALMTATVAAAAGGRP